MKINLNYDTFATEHLEKLGKKFHMDWWTGKSFLWQNIISNWIWKQETEQYVTLLNRYRVTVWLINELLNH